ncbi:hypothetical protein [Streptomyces sp. 6N106]|uniref:hypothetical protein n=1 Tax=Streptomyces sp. 6N106 TaxID=3457418 RepID=UPI003FD4C733
MSDTILITHLRHIDVAMPNFAEQRRFYTELWGLTESHGDTGVSFLAAEGSVNGSGCLRWRTYATCGWPGSVRTSSPPPTPSG